MRVFSQFSKGRIVALGRAKYFEREVTEDSMRLFIQNAITWVSKNKKHIVVGTHFKDVKSDKYKVKMLTPKELKKHKDVTVYIVNAEERRSDDDIKIIQDFVLNGGGLLIGGQAWSFPGTKSILDYPGNR